MIAIRSAMLVCLCVSMASVARANPEPPANYDARVAGMGGVAIATLENAAGLFHNPAQLEHIERFSLTIVATSLLVNLRAPFSGSGSEMDSGLIFAPLMFAGGVGRIHERVTIGLGGYVYTGFGGGFSGVDCLSYNDPALCTDPMYAGRIDPPSSEDVTLFVTEFALPVQVSVHERVSIGVTFRLPWARMDVSATQDVPNGNDDTIFLQRANQELTGTGIPGVLLGISVRPIDRLTISAAYRSKVYVNLDGTTQVSLGGADLDVPTSSRWYVPHMIRVGAAIRAWRDRFVFSAEFKVQMHDEANQEQFFELDSPLAPNTRARFEWQNVYLGSIAAELWVAPRIPLRFGMTLGRSASVPETLTPFSPPPGIQLGVYGGFGVRAGPMDIDLAFGWGGGPAHVIDEDYPLCADADVRTSGAGAGRTLEASGGCAGSYDVDSYFLSLSATYSFGRPDVGSD